jgi:hypothetical protein
MEAAQYRLTDNGSAAHVQKRFSRNGVILHRRLSSPAAAAKPLRLIVPRLGFEPPTARFEGQILGEKPFAMRFNTGHLLGKQYVTVR